MSDAFESIEDLQYAGSSPGPWVEAQYTGMCSGCGDEFYSGDEIRADGSGGWEGQCCDD